jgi:iron complex outermembrane receptor protein
MKSFLAALLAVLLPFCMQAQSSISGIVTDTEGEALIGANIYILNTFQGAITDINGRYSINNLPAGRYVVQASYIGYDNAVQSIELDGITEINFSLEKKSYLAEEVIVTAIRAGNRSPVAFTNVGREEITNRNMGQDIPYLLSLTPSLVSTSDAGTGIGYASFRVRGTDMNRINITVNGIPLNDAESHGVWWVDLPDFAGSVDDVQIQRGVGTSTNGGAAFGATLNFQTFKLNPEPYAELNASYGSFNSWKTSITAGTGLLKDKFSIDMRLSRIGSE